MPKSIRWKGTTIRRPGVYTYHDLAGLLNTDLGADSAVMVFGEASAGEPQVSGATPVVHVFTDPNDMIETFQSGNLAEMARCLFDPAMNGQHEEGIAIHGAAKVYAIKTNVSTQASYSIQDQALAATAITLKDRIWGVEGNNTYFGTTISGTGFTLTIGRYRDPFAGTETLGPFGVTGSDEWLSLITIPAEFTGATCTVTFDGTTLAINSNIGAEDLNVTVAGKTMSDIVAEINSFDSGLGTGPCYAATLLRADRGATLASYMDRVVIADDLKSPATADIMGAGYDVVEAVEADSVYCNATWVAGYAPYDSYTTPTFLLNGALGDSSVVSVTDALKVLNRFSPRFIASGFNGDSVGGTVTLAAGNTLFMSHLNKANAIGGRSERQGFMSDNATVKATLYTNIQNHNCEWVSVNNNRIYRENESVTKTWLGSHCVSACLAGIAAGSVVATPLTCKYLKCYDFDYLSTNFDPSDETDFANGIDYGLLMLESDPGIGTRVAKGISTYRLLDNDARILFEVVEARLWHRRTLRHALEKPQIGHKGKGLLTVKQILGVVKSVHRTLADPQNPDFILIETTDETGSILPPYRNLRASLNGDQVYVYGELTFTMGVNFIFNDFRATLPSAFVS